MNKSTSVDISLTVSTCKCLSYICKSTLVDIPLTVSTSLSISKYKAKATLVGILLAALTMSRFDIFLLPTISRRFHYSFNKNDCLKNTLSTLVDIPLTVSTIIDRCPANSSTSVDISLTVSTKTPISSNT